MNPIGPGNHDRAWNDPPKFAFNASGAAASGATGGRRRLLNKRVPVPIGPSSTSSPVPPVLRPGDTPPTMGNIPLRPPRVDPLPIQPSPVNCLHDVKPKIPVGSRTDEVKPSENAQELLEEVDLALKNSLESISVELKDSVRDEINKRVSTMKTMWLDGKLNNVVQRRILSLARALTQEEYDIAWTLHQGLIVDYTSMCSPWMVGIKTLISECRNHSKGEANINSASPAKDDENKEKLDIDPVMGVEDMTVREKDSDTGSRCESDATVCDTVVEKPENKSPS
ncbi:steroid receptor RNA activator 1-like [Homarus americanus]|uniref:Steroid receptor RNA activator 1-like n=1 Tax=Homarus americanus TaxID=6706 RepID=A0A8J5JAH2_HOMAM|nr:steroid receptor RNA activator 1-like [Homarus americanus]KAG7153873.1 Steroid receptor RNA activator 1-like [Homarus americanus]